MHIYFSGIGGAGIGPLALIAHQAGYEVSGSDKQASDYLNYLGAHGINDIHIGQETDEIARIHSKKPIDWLVYTSALDKESSSHPELEFCKDNDIKTSKRDEFINQILADKQLKMIAIAGTHGKTTTTAMTIWLFKQLQIPVSYSVGAKLSFGEMGEYAEGSEYFIYEADEYDRNFLEFKPEVSIITGISWDHPDIYPTQADYNKAFVDFICQSNHDYAHPQDYENIGLAGLPETIALSNFSLVGEVNRKNAQLVVEAVSEITGKSIDELVPLMNMFPGVSRRFEQLAPNLYTDYAHTPEKIRGALQTAEEVAGGKVVVVYEGLHNTRQHFIQNELVHLFDNAKHIYVVPSYLAREDKSLALLSPQDIVNMLSVKQSASASILDDQLKQSIQQHLSDDDLVICLSAGGGGSLDEWLRKNF